MKRGMVGGAYRGPVGVNRQRRTIRLVQVILVLIAAGLLMFAGYSMGRSTGYDQGLEAGDELSPPRPPSTAQTVVLAVLGLGALGAAFALQGSGGVRLLTPAKLIEMENVGEPVLVDEDAEGTEEMTTESAGS